MASDDRAGNEVSDLLESFRQVGQTGQAGLAAARDASKALRTLVSADVSLARSAFGRTLAFTGVAIVLGSVGGLMIAASLVTLLASKAGLPWTVSLLIVGGLWLLAAVLAGWRAVRYFEHTRMKATRRQLARLGIGELAEMAPDPGSAQSSKEAAESMPTETTTGTPVKDKQGIEVTPP